MTAALFACLCIIILANMTFGAAAYRTWSQGFRAGFVIVMVWAGVAASAAVFGAGLAISALVERGSW